MTMTIETKVIHLLDGDCIEITFYPESLNGLISNLFMYDDLIVLKDSTNHLLDRLCRFKQQENLLNKSSRTHIVNLEEANAIIHDLAYIVEDAEHVSKYTAWLGLSLSSAIKKIEIMQLEKQMIMSIGISQGKNNEKTTNSS